MTREVLPDPPARAPDLFDDFTGPALRDELWIDHYLPHWSRRNGPGPDTTWTRAACGCGSTRTSPDWRPDDAPLRVSNVQTGDFSGPDDDRLRTDMTEVNAALPHTWTVIWGAGRHGDRLCRGGRRPVRAGPGYPLVLMLDLFEIGGRSPGGSAHPESARVHRVRGPHR